VKVVSLVEPALTLGIVSLGAGVGAFSLGVEPVGAILIAATIPTAMVCVLASLGGIMLLIEKKEQRALSAIDPDWEMKARSVNSRLKAAVYRWQLREFGYASKAFSVQQNLNDDHVVFGKFRAVNDIDPFDFEGSDEEFMEAADAREKAVSALVASAESEARLQADLDGVLARNLEPELRRELLRRRKFDINTTVLL
jgi:hypothetical protein